MASVPQDDSSTLVVKGKFRAYYVYMAVVPYGDTPIGSKAV